MALSVSRTPAFTALAETGADIMFGLSLDELAGKLKDGVSDALFEALVFAAIHRDALIPSASGSIPDEPRTPETEALASLACKRMSKGSLGDFDLLPALGALHLSAFVIHGRQDPIPLASSEAVARALGAPCIVLEDCGHVPYVEQPAHLFPPLLAYLREP